nr:MAG TPA: hypothetical protein [Caudoviricetes sp.]
MIVNYFCRNKFTLTIIFLIAFYLLFNCFLVFLNRINTILFL